jgi:hypothetical protein
LNETQQKAVDVPWRFRFDGRASHLSVDNPRDTYRIPKRLDRGIAMPHFELGARAAGADGRWSLLEHPDVALYLPTRGESQQ